MLLLRERTGKLGVAGIVLAVISLPLFDYSPGGRRAHYGSWFLLALAVMVAWGLQAYFIKLANATMSAESIFVYMMLIGLLFIPVALAAHRLLASPINLGLYGPWLAAAIQMLNAIGALLLVYAFRYGKAIVVSPLVNAGAPLLTSLIALAVAGITARSVQAGGHRAGAGRRAAAVAAARVSAESADLRMKALLELIARHKAGSAVGIYSVCSAHPLVIEAALREALRRWRSTR